MAIVDGKWVPDSQMVGGTNAGTFLALNPTTNKLEDLSTFSNNDFNLYAQANPEAMQTIGAGGYQATGTNLGITGTSSGMGDFFKAGLGGSTFANTAQGLGSLYGIYAMHEGIGAAKDARNFEKQKYADLKVLQDKHEANKDALGLAMQSAAKQSGMIK